jgi:hypothetical protein
MSIRNIDLRPFCHVGKDALLFLFPACSLVQGSPINHPSNPQFDVFLKKRKQGWAYSGSVEAKSITDAKTKLLRDNPDLTVTQVAVYPKR